jgi:cytochrome c553
MKFDLSWVVAACALLWGAGSAFAAVDAAAGAGKARTCAACHGGDGNSTSTNTPKLAGQMPEYLIKQMRDLQDGRRSNCRGLGQGAAKIAEADLIDIAAHFSAQRLQPATVDNARLALGEQIYSKGRKPPRFVPACIGCHGLQGRGKTDWSRILTSPPAILPSSIGGQHPAYLAAQLRAFRDGRRANDQAAVMRKLAANLTDEEIDAAAAYAAALVR